MLSVPLQLRVPSDTTCSSATYMATCIFTPGPNHTITTSCQPTHPLVHVQQRLVAHVQRAHELQRRDLQREVEGCDERHGAVRPAVAAAGLARVVPGHGEAASQEADLRAGEASEPMCEYCWARR